MSTTRPGAALRAYVGAWVAATVVVTAVNVLAVRATPVDTTRLLVLIAVVAAAELTGASWVHIVFREVLPNCLSPILSKILLDTGFIIIIAASLSFVGLGSQPPAPDLGSMIAAGTDYLPANWWLTAFPSLALLYAAFSVNMLGDGIRELLEKNK